MRIVKCDNCGKEFKKKHVRKTQNHVFCSTECGHKFRKGKKFIYEEKRIVKTCLNCGKEFSVLISKILNRGKKYCGIECYFAGRAAKVKKKCVVCGKDFAVHACHDNRTVINVCSIECKKAYRKKGLTKDQLTKTCTTCGKQFTIKPCELSKNRHHCSKECQKRRVMKVCLTCGKSFESATKNQSTFCSNKCYKSYRGESSIEKIVREYLENKNIVFDTQIQFKNYVVDFLLPAVYKIIETDGNYWHDKKGVKERDMRKDMYLNSLGFEVIRLKEDEIKNGEYEKKLCLS